MPPQSPEPPGPPRQRPDPVAIGCNALFALLLLIPAAGLVVLALVVVASVPLMVALFPTAITLAAVTLAVLYWRHRRARKERPRARTGRDAPSHADDSGPL
jgi:membrane protein implicated in regulation of membrane protease activity